MGLATVATAAGAQAALLAATGTATLGPAGRTAGSRHLGQRCTT